MLGLRFHAGKECDRTFLTIVVAERTYEFETVRGSEGNDGCHVHPTAEHVSHDDSNRFDTYGDFEDEG